MRRIFLIALVLAGLFLQGCVVGSSQDASLPVASASAETLDPDDYDWEKSSFKEKRLFLIGIVTGRRESCASAAYAHFKGSEEEAHKLSELCLEPVRGINSLEKIDQVARLMDQTLADETFSVFTVSEISWMAFGCVSAGEPTSVYWAAMESWKKDKYKQLGISPEVETKPRAQEDYSMIDIFDRNARNIMGQ